MQSPTRASAPIPASFEIRVCSPEHDALSDGEVRRLFPGGALTGPRLDRLRSWPRVVVLLEGRIAGLATYQKHERELRVPDVAVDAAQIACRRPGRPVIGEREIIHALLDALEVTCLASGCVRIVVNPPKLSIRDMQRRGYSSVDERCAGGWIEKIIADL